LPGFLTKKIEMNEVHFKLEQKVNGEKQQVLRLVRLLLTLFQAWTIVCRCIKGEMENKMENEKW